MAQTCSVCKHPKRDAIDAALLNDVPLRDIEGQYGTARSSLSRHRDKHIPAALALAKQAEEVADADDLLARINSLQDKTFELMEKAEKAGEHSVAISAVNAARRNLELMAKLRGELDERPVINVRVSPQWVTIRAVLLDVLSPYPEARVAAAKALVQLEE